ncbi:ATP-binding cassette domain-containing protein [Bacillus cereus]
MSLASSYTELLVLKSYFDRIYEILASRTEENLSKKNGITDIEEIKLSNVNFRYSEFEDMSLKNINLVIKKNEKVAIVGRSGCGKSTLLKVLSSLYIPNTGNFFINNKKITELNPREYRKSIGIINQHPDIFSGSIVENIILDGFDISKDSLYLENVIRLSDVQSIIEGLPLGIHTQISEGGANLSGGQKQKLALARALYKKPPLLIMDEPTSALDNPSEKNIMDNIKDLNMTCVVAAHRLNTIKNFDRILVMHNGEIVEEGSHNQLINQRGYYYEIYSNEIGKGKERYEEVNV